MQQQQQLSKNSMESRPYLRLSAGPQVYLVAGQSKGVATIYIVLLVWALSRGFLSLRVLVY